MKVVREWCRISDTISDPIELTNVARQSCPPHSVIAAWWNDTPTCFHAAILLSENMNWRRCIMRRSRGSHATEGTISRLDVLRCGISIGPRTAWGQEGHFGRSDPTSVLPPDSEQIPQRREMS